MLKRNIAILIAGGLLGAQVNVAAADQGTFPSNDTGVIWKLLPAQLKYLEQRAASIQKEGVALRGGSFPVARSPSPSAGTGFGASYKSPAQLKYLEQRAASIQKDGIALRGDSFPPSADDLYWTTLPAQVKYFEQRAASIQKERVVLRSDSFPPSVD